MMKFFEYESTSLVSRAFVFIVIFYVLVLSSLPAYHLSAIFNSASEAFHQGEMLGNVWHMLAYYQGVASFPIFIHGGMDYWPSLIAKFCFGENHIIFGTRLIVVFATMISWIVFLNLGISLLLKAGASLTQQMLFIGIFILTLPFSDFSVMAIEESPVGMRDAVILCQAYLLFKYCYSDDARKNYFLVFMFFLQPLAIYWAYDRGVASSLGCLVVILMLLKQRKFTELIPLFLASALSFGLLEVTRIGGTLSENLINIQYWASHSKEVWGLRFHFRGSIVFLMPICSLFLLFVYLFSKRESISKDKLLWLVFLFVIELLLLKSALNRPNLHRVLMSAWPSILILMSIMGAKARAVTPVPIAVNRFNSIQGVRHLALILLLIPIALFRLPVEQVNEFGKMVRHMPSDSNLAGGGIMSAAKSLEGQSCSVNFVNQGVITLMSRTKHCTKFPYMIYASESEQKALIEDIQNASPVSVIIDSNDWSSGIDGRLMKNRLPMLYDYFIKNYPQSSSVGNYAVLTKKGS